MCQAVTFNLSHCTAAEGPGFSLYFCFDWGLIVTLLELGVHSEEGEMPRALITCLQFVLLGVWTKGICVSVGTRAVVPTDLFTPNHMSNLIPVFSFELMSCVSSSNLSHWLIWRPCRKAGNGGWVRTEEVCTVAQLHEWGKLRRYRLTRKEKRVEGVMGRGESGREFSQRQLSSN